MTPASTHTIGSPETARWRALNWLSIICIVALMLPAVYIRLSGTHLDPRISAGIYGLAVIGAAFLLSWSAEVAQHDIPRALALTILALIAVLPEYAVDAYLAWRAAGDPAGYGPLALANMTGANRLLIGVAWPLVVFLYWLKSRRVNPGGEDNDAVIISREQGIEVGCLALATIYSFIIPLKGTLSLIDLLFLVTIFAFYSYRVSQSEHEEPDLIGPAKLIGDFPVAKRRGTVIGFFVLAAVVIYLSAEPFAESLIEAGTELGFDRRTLIQWLAPLASEAPEFIITSIFAWRLMADASLGALVSSKINQWTLLVSSIPLVYNIGTWRLGKSVPTALSLNEVQRADLLLTSAQSLFAVCLLLGLRLSVRSAALLFGLFIFQFLVPSMLMPMVGVYVALSFICIYRNRMQLKMLWKDLRG